LAWGIFVPVSAHHFAALRNIYAFDLTRMECRLA
jgi:hypothetical protein